LFNLNSSKSIGGIVVFGSLLCTLFASDITIKPRQLSYMMESCTECHYEGYEEDMDATPRDLVEMHDDIILDHGNDRFWCLECHDPSNGYQLNNTSKIKASFEKSVELCGKCHGKIHDDWKVGVHTKMFGGWNKPKTALQCVECHSPHQPKFKKITPKSIPLYGDKLQLHKEYLKRKHDHNIESHGDVDDHSDEHKEDEHE
jgi:nitrate reductase cytochrome c-type subunit